MRYYFVNTCFLLLFSVPAFFVSGCASTSVDLDSPAHQAMIAQDLATIHPASGGDQLTGPVHLTLDQALKRGVLSNLDARVAMLETLAEHDEISLEKLRALPDITASAARLGRTNIGASSSESILTKQESLEPSQSSDQYRRTADIEVTWNLIDTILALQDARSAKDEEQIAAQRYRKVVQNIQRDIYAAYWKAVAQQETAPQTQTLSAALKKQIAGLEQARAQGLMSAGTTSQKIGALQDQLQKLSYAQDRLALSRVELKSLLSLPQDTTLELAAPGPDYLARYQQLNAQDIQAAEWQALLKRPEINEEILKKNIAEREIRNELIKTFPGLELFVGGHYDSNSFLVDANWGSYSAQIVSSLSSLITAPARYRNAENQSLLADARRQALILAVLAQSRIAHHRFALAQDNFAYASTSEKNAAKQAMVARHEKANGFTSGFDALSAATNQQIKTIEMRLANAQLHDSYAAYLNTLGQDFYPDSQGQEDAL